MRRGRRGRRGGGGIGGGRRRPRRRRRRRRRPPPSPPPPPPRRRRRRLGATGRDGEVPPVRPVVRIPIRIRIGHAARGTRGTSVRGAVEAHEGVDTGGAAATRGMPHGEGGDEGGLEEGRQVQVGRYLSFSLFSFAFLVIYCANRYCFARRVDDDEVAWNDISTNDRFFPHSRPSPLPSNPHPKNAENIASTGGSTFRSTSFCSN